MHVVGSHDASLVLLPATVALCFPAQWGGSEERRPAVRRQPDIPLLRSALRSAVRLPWPGFLYFQGKHAAQPLAGGGVEGVLFARQPCSQWFQSNNNQLWHIHTHLHTHKKVLLLVVCMENVAHTQHVQQKNLKSLKLLMQQRLPWQHTGVGCYPNSKVMKQRLITKPETCTIISFCVWRLKAHILFSMLLKYFFPNHILSTFLLFNTKQS